MTTTAAEKAYCRLCAKIKSPAKLINLTYYTEKRDVIVSKLNKFYINIEFNASDDELPSTVCLTCINSLNNACDFITSIQKAQETLKEELWNIKKEDLSDLDQDVTDTDIQVKKESYELEIEPMEMVKSNININNNKVVNDSTENIPLSLLKLTWEDYKWQCAYCDTLFPNVAELKKHSIQFHQCCNAFKCTDCNVRISRIKNFLCHVKGIHKQYLRLSCHICYTKFSKPSEAILHRKLHIKTKFFCVGCHESFKTAEELNKHSKSYKKYFIKKGIAGVNNELICSVCHESFSQRGLLKAHMLLHTVKQNKYTCEKCGKGFVNKSNVDDHVLTVHEGFRPFQCQICNFKFRCLAHLRRHVGIHDGDKPFECEHCGKCFRLQVHLKNHSIIHTDKLPHVCSYCNKGFKFKSILNQHIRQHTGVKPYSCEQCDKNFTGWPNYNKHMKLKHNMDMSKKKRTPNGVQPIDPKTGELIYYETTHTIDEWKKEVLKTVGKPGRKSQ